MKHVNWLSMPNAPVYSCAAALGGALLIHAIPAAAVPVVYDYTVTVTQGPLAGNAFSGSFSYDDQALTGVGQEIVTVEEGLTVSSDFFGDLYRETDDTNYPEFPQLVFENGELKRLDFWVEDGQRIVWWDLPGWEVDLTLRPAVSTPTLPSADGTTAEPAAEGAQ